MTFGSRRIWRRTGPYLKAGIRAPDRQATGPAPGARAAADRLPAEAARAPDPEAARELAAGEVDLALAAERAAAAALRRVAAAVVPVRVPAAGVAETRELQTRASVAPGAADCRNAPGTGRATERASFALSPHAYSGATTRTHPRAQPATVARSRSIQEPWTVPWWLAHVRHSLRMPRPRSTAPHWVISFTFPASIQSLIQWDARTA